MPRYSRSTDEIGGKLLAVDLAVGIAWRQTAAHMRRAPAPCKPAAASGSSANSAAMSSASPSTAAATDDDYLAELRMRYAERRASPRRRCVA